MRVVLPCLIFFAFSDCARSEDPAETGIKGTSHLLSAELLENPDPELLTKLLSPAIPHNWKLRSNQTGTSVIVPLIETEEARRFSALVRRIESFAGSLYFKLSANSDLP